MHRTELIEDDGWQLGHTGRNSQPPIHLDDDDDLQINSKNESEYDDEENDDMVSIGCQNIIEKLINYLHFANVFSSMDKNN